MCAGRGCRLTSVPAESAIPDFELYFNPGACSRVTHIALEELGVPFTPRFVPLERPPEFLALNPKAKVPVLTVDGVPLTETVAILTYLDRTFPHAALLPDGDALRSASVLSVLAWIASGLHPMITRMRRPDRFHDDPRAASRVRTMALDQLTPSLDLLEQAFSERPWFFDSWSIVDAYLYWIWYRATGAELDPALYPAYTAHAARVLARPAVRRALAREQLFEAEHGR